jgi:hypothetical protein
VVDAYGITGQVSTPAAPLTLITAFDTILTGLRFGVVYWNPETDDFCWFGWTGSFGHGLTLVQARYAAAVEPQCEPDGGGLVCSSGEVVSSVLSYDVAPGEMMAGISHAYERGVSGAVAGGVRSAGVTSAG